MKVSPININTYYKNTSAPVKSSFNTVTVEKTQNNELSNYYYLPVSFTAKSKRISTTDKPELAEKSWNFQLSKYSDIPCPACGKFMINNEKFNAIAEELKEIPQDEYLEYLGKFKKYMRPVEESVYNELVELSKKRGQSNDIRELLVNLRDKKLPILQKTQIKQVKKMQALAKKLPADEQSALLGKMERLQQLIYKSNSEAPFRRKRLIEGISRVEIRNKNKYDKLQKLAHKFPTSEDMNSAWIVKYSGKNKAGEPWNSYDIALRFLTSSVANTDHIIAYDLEKGHDDISNYLSMHNGCNSQKSNKPFMEWVHEDGDRNKHLKEYLFGANRIIMQKPKLRRSNYRHYIEHVTETIKNVSAGEVDVYDEVITKIKQSKREEHQMKKSLALNAENNIQQSASEEAEKAAVLC